MVQDKFHKNLKITDSIPAEELVREDQRTAKKKRIKPTIDWALNPVIPRSERLKTRTELNKNALSWISVWVWLAAISNVEDAGDAWIAIEFGRIRHRRPSQEHNVSRNNGGLQESRCRVMLLYLNSRVDEVLDKRTHTLGRIETTEMIKQRIILKLMKNLCRLQEFVVSVKLPP